MFSLTKNLLPDIFRPYFAKPTHRYETRYSLSNFSLGRYTSQRSESSIKVIGPKTWAKIPEKLKILPFRKTFSKQLKQNYLSELPTEKRTKNLDIDNSKTNNRNNAELKEIFEDSEDDSTFLGFDMTINLSTLFNVTDGDVTFLGF